MVTYTRHFWNGNEYIYDPKKKAFNKKVSFFEAITESLGQLGLSSFIFKVFGISKHLGALMLQFFSLSMSIISLTVAFIQVIEIPT